jgi:DNA repair photolyase
MSHSPELFAGATDAAPAHSPQVTWAARQGSVLQHTGLPLVGASGLNLMRGCVHRCAFCSVRASPNYSNDEVVLYSDLAERLAEELRTHRKPRAVFISPATDPFPPLDAVQQSAAAAVEVLAQHHVEAWLMTRGLIRRPALDALTAHRRWVKVTIALTTQDRILNRRLEPGTAPPRLRLRQIKRLRERGVAVQAALDPLIPGVTDTRENLVAVLAALAAVGVRHVTASYMFLREGVADSLSAALEPLALAEAVLEQYRNGPVLSAPGLAPARYLPRGRRQRGYATLMALAADYGIGVGVSRTTNPDFGAAPAGASTGQTAEPRRRLLPLFMAAARPLVRV